MASKGESKGIVMFLETTSKFMDHSLPGEMENGEEERSLRFLFGYFKKYRKSFGLIFLSLVIGSLIQLVLPFLTQSIVDKGIRGKNIDIIWLILLGQLMLTISRTLVDFTSY